MTYTSPKLTLTFKGNDLPVGHLEIQDITYDYIINGSIRRNMQLMDGLKSSSNQIQLQLSRSCQSTEDIIATSGDIEAVLTDGNTKLFTGYVSTDFSWNVTKHGEQVLQISLEDVGTRLFSKPFIETGKHFFSGTASSAVNAICAAVGVTVHPDHTSALTQTIAFTAEAGATCKDLITQLCYECNAVYYFDANGLLCIFKISPSTSGAAKYDGSKLVDSGGSVISLSKKLRTYKGARVAYDEIATADNYLVYRNTTGQDSDHQYCNLELQPGEHFDGTEIYTAQEWSEATADTFREPALIGAVNAASESQIVGSNAIINISNLSATTVKTGSLTATFTNVGGGYFKLDATNPGSSAGAFTRMDLYASIVYVKSHGVVRTAIDGVSSGKVLLEEELRWIRDKSNAEKHANLLAQYNQFSGATYTFYSATQIPLGSVIELNDNVYSGLDVYVMVYRSEDNDVNSIIAYKAVAITTFDLTERAYYGVSEQGPQSGTQGPPGPKGDSMVVEYALGTYTEPIYPPSEDMTWEGDPMLWDSETMQWGMSPWSTTQPALVRGMCIWMRTKVGSGPWIYSRLTGLAAWEPLCVGVATEATPTETQTGLSLVYGDYFVCGETFEEDGYTYHEGYVYTYDGNGHWYTMDLSDPENSEKALYACNELINSGINVTDSTASVYGWFRNLVAQNAVVANLFARNIQVGDGTGEAGTGFRFRAQEYNQYGQKLEHPNFDVYFGDKMLFSVDSDGKIFFGDGFWYNPTDSAIHSTDDNVVINAEGLINTKNAIITGSSTFNGSFDCDVIKTVQQNPDLYPYASTTNSAQQCKLLVDAIMAGGHVPYTDDGYVRSDYFRASLSVTSSIYYARFTITNGGAYYLYFYDSSLNELDLSSIVSLTRTSTVAPSNCLYSASSTTLGTYATNGITVIVITGGNVLQVDIPSSDSASSLASGQLYYDKTTGSVMMKL